MSCRGRPWPCACQKPNPTHTRARATRAVAAVVSAPAPTNTCRTGGLRITRTSLCALTLFWAHTSRHISIMLSA